MKPDPSQFSNPLIYADALEESGYEQDAGIVRWDHFFVRLLPTKVPTQWHGSRAVQEWLDEDLPSFRCG